MSPIGSVIIASASSVVKTFLIGLVGYISVKRPKDRPLLPKNQINMLSRFSFHTFSLSLIYTGIASTVTLNQLSKLWPVFVSSLLIICISFATTSLFGKLFRVSRVISKSEICALVMGTTFSNIIAIPILIFPTLCEYPVVYNKFVQDYQGKDNSNESFLLMTDDEKVRNCIDLSMANLFIYFLGWSIFFWSVGNQVLLSSAKKNQEREEENKQRENLCTIPDENEDSSIETPEIDHGNNHIYKENYTLEDSPVLTLNESPPLYSNVTRNSTVESIHPQIETALEDINNSKPASKSKTLLSSIKAILLNVFFSPGFIALILGMITVCIRPLQNALFSRGGALRFLGSALESLSGAAGPSGTIIVAASLAEGVNVISSPPATNETTNTNQLPTCDIKTKTNSSAKITKVETLNNFLRSSYSYLNHGRRRSLVSVQEFFHKPAFNIYLWHILSRLVFTPFVVCAILTTLHCTKASYLMSNLSKLVLLINAAVPGALIVVIVLKSNGFTKEAAIVSQSYFPTYVLSIFTLGAWTAVGLSIFQVDEDGNNVCPF